MKKLIPIIFLITILSVTQSYKILVLIPFPGPSHFIMISTIIEELLHRGHTVTTVTNFHYKGELNKNYTEIFIDPPYDFGGNFAPEILYEMKYDSDFQNLYMYMDIGLTSSKHGLENKKIQNLIERNDLQFDLIISEQFFQESWLLFAHKYNAPIITIGTYGYSDFMDRAMGLLTPLSFVPHMLLDNRDKMSFFERCYNVFLTSYDMFLRNYYYLPEQNKLAKIYFSSLKQPIPSVYDLEKSISVMLVNSHRAISQPRPGMPGLINIGGAHIKPTKTLPSDIQKFLDDDDGRGVIYFSLGAFIQSSQMPKDKVRMFLDVFGKLHQKVLWKWEDDKIPNLPKNVMVRKWMPQTDILAHKNVVLFITHGGMFGTSEGIKFGVPMLFLPFFGDQHRNALKSQSGGYALILKFSEISLEKLENRLNEMLNKKIYYERAKQVSALFTDNPIQPMEEAMFWIEYVIRHKGARHLKSAAVNLPWYSYLLLDVYGFFLFIILSTIYIVYKSLSLILCRKKNIVKQGNNKKKN